MRVAVRRWRDGSDVPDLHLWCTSEIEATLRLKHVALWATQLGCRLHFEWVWSGRELRIVQADLADPGPGVNPRSLRPLDIPKIELTSLRLFKAAEAQDFAQFSKLHNAKIYRELGYEMPAFYVLRDARTLGEVLDGKITPDFEHDLTELTKRPLIIRTDGTEIPEEKRQMLPRSDELRSVADARDWLVSKFKTSIQANALQSAALCLIAHHFIPSVSAAWALAEPAKRMVRIESLWGVPEGLYWYSHDTFEVDTQDNSPEKLKDFTVRERLRYKGTFIAPDSNGRWLPFRIAAPYDWARSIKSQAWIREIAATTRRVAEYESHPVVVMWFIENDPRATRHIVLPWYHSKSKLGAPKRAPRRKLAFAADFRIETEQDWMELKTQVTSGSRIERIVIEPKDADLVRNQQFAEELAKFAAAHNIVVELAGGILSHGYYMLQRHGAQVECIDLFGADEDVIEYNKLVRDKIPDLIQGGGEDVEVVQLRGEALLTALRQKLVEEGFEALDAKSADELIGELADVSEVINGICKALQVTDQQLDDERTKKAKRRGGFETGVMLRRTSMPGSLSPRESLPSGAFSIEPSASPASIIQEPTAIPTNPPYRRADLRNVDQRPERLLTLETGLTNLGSKKETTSFAILAEGESHQFTVTVELTRNRSSVRVSVGVRSEGPQRRSVADSQLTFDFRE
jgi:predicted house-cleaning noncanonical NTP pyrophosphatase (MazG superfamily)